VIETTRRVGNLPAEIGDLIGRSAELAELGRLIRDSSLVTLTGVAGVGKTRLAVEAGRLGAFPDGVWFADLSGEHDGRLLAHGVSAVLGLGEQAARPQHEVLGELLAGKRMLLILDTCEHLIADCRTLADQIIALAPEVRVLATSRQPLGLPYERVLRVEPLPVPPADDERADRYDAVRLLAERAEALGVTGVGCWRSLGRICRRLDGLPLAIEFAARRLRVLSAEQLADRPGDGFTVLGDLSGRAAAGRHRTLRTAVGWSHELCTPEERLLWARLSVFPGAFDIGSAVTVCADHRLKDVARPLSRLIEKSVLTRNTAGRCRVYAPLREYGAWWLRELGEEERMRRSHYRHYREAADRADAEWAGPAQLDWTDWAHRESANLRAAIERTVTGAEGLELVAALWFLWFCAGRVNEGRRYLEEALAHNAGPSPARTRALVASAWVALAQGDLETAADRSIEALEAAADQGDDVMAGSAVHVAAALSLVRDDLDRAEKLIGEAVDILRRADESGIAYAMAQPTHAMILGRLREHERAEQVLRTHRAWCERKGELWTRSYGDYARSLVEFGRGRLDLAEEHVHAALAAKWRLGDALGSALAVDQLAAIAAARGDGERSARLLGAGQRIWSALGHPRYGPRVFGRPRHVTEARVRTMIGDAMYEAAYTRGTHMDPTGVID
jgi:predicted ATPase